MTDPTRRMILAGAPAVAVAAATRVNASPAAFGMSDAIEAHRTAYERYCASLDAQDAAEDAFEALPPHTLVKGLYGAHYEARLGREFALGNIAREHESALRNVRASLTKIGIPEQHIANSIGKANAKRDAVVSAINAFFDAEDTRRAASPLGAADRAKDEANDAEEVAWDALLAFPCATLADVRAKAGYLAMCERTRGVSLPQVDAAALLQSLIGASASPSSIRTPCRIFALVKSRYAT